MGRGSTRWAVIRCLVARSAKTERWSVVTVVLLTSTWWRQPAQEAELGLPLVYTPAETLIRDPRLDWVKRLLQCVSVCLCGCEERFAVWFSTMKT